MLTRIGSRLAQAVLVVLAVSALVLALTALSGDPAALILPIDATDAQRAAFREGAGLNDPFLEQYGRFLASVVTGEFRPSLSQGTDAMGLVLARMGATLLLAASAMLVAAMVAVPLGTLMAHRRGRLTDAAARLLVLVGQCTPGFVVAIMLTLVFAVNLGLLPVLGGLSGGGLVLPVATVALLAAAETTRLVRSSVLEQLDSDHVRAARARGVPEPVVFLRHVVRNALVPVVTMWGLQFGAMLGGVIAVEAVFSYPGLGELALQAISARDLPVIQCFALVATVMVVLVNLLVDLLYPVLDPRVRRPAAGGAA